ncbi:MAG: hypothetical protein K0S18_11 [Anaerocolumna sp.]|jgi:hypothetical protein|nr:hypothetical protein [Anaerocolumna sp.]
MIKENKKKMEFSKKILVTSYIIAISLTLFMLVGIIFKIDVSPIENITLASWGEVTAANTFYYIKSKVENRIKIISSLPQEFKDQVDINQIINQ